MLNDGTRNASCGSRDCTRNRSRNLCSTRHHRAKYLGRDRAYSWDKPHCRFEQTPEKRTDARIATVASVIISLRPVVAHLVPPSLPKNHLLHADLVRSERGTVALVCRRLLSGRCFCFGLYHQPRCLLGTIQQSLAARAHILPIKIAALYESRQRLEHLLMLFQPFFEFRQSPHTM